ncbi:serine O-acetyltransferase [Sporolactobacillus terrae]|uniref:serine O-acetyltransferase n=1 Tax=Sporolactobacillus terrae TaxID=269673 RepID=UPI000685A695|nr:serine acetyltransferase [Sporolactobacillus terrae]
METLKNDLKNYAKNATMKNMIVKYLLEPGFKYTVHLRICQKLYHKKFLKPLYILARLRLNHYQYKYGIQIYPSSPIGDYLNIPHFGCIVVHNKAKIGHHCTIRHGVTIGRTSQGIPSLGNFVSIGAGAKIIGPIKIGNNVTVGANAVVNRDVPDNCVVAGIPARIIKLNGERVNLTLKEYWNQQNELSV